MKSIKELVREEVSKFQPYIPGMPVEELRRKFNIKSKVIKLASNENPLGVSKKVVSAIKKSASEIYRYPEGSSLLLRRAIAKKLKIKPEEVIVGSGTDELIELIGKCFFKRNDEIVVSEHAFIRYKMSGDLMGCKVISVPMTTPLQTAFSTHRGTGSGIGAGFTHDLDAMAKAVNEKTKAVFIANPNNPTGTYNTKTEVEKFLKYLTSAALSPLVIFDEAYYEYARVQKDYPETIEYFRGGRDGKYPNLIILRTFSKVFGLAGLRVGYAIANSEIISFLDRIRPPFNVNSLAQIAALVCLKEWGKEGNKNSLEIKKSVQVVQAGKKYLYRELERLGLKYVNSAANFVFIDVSPLKGQEVFQKLLRYGVIVRAMDEYDFPNHIRVTVGLPSENKFFIRAIQKVIKERKNLNDT
ncbi:MAG: histidinol-phosphate transaminase [Elusimicrobiota bacterium]|nr:histidinol-phosphate transaminase [Elusimicrobiota bacterium]